MALAVTIGSETFSILQRYFEKKFGTHKGSKSYQVQTVPDGITFKNLMFSSVTKVSDAVPVVLYLRTLQTCFLELPVFNPISLETRKDVAKCYLQSWKA